jgi:hypothetical protein
MSEKVMLAELDIFRGRDGKVHFKNKGTGHLAFKMNCSQGQLECKDRQYMVYIPIELLLTVLARECNCTVSLNTD